MDWKYLFTSFEGRISRKPFWLGNLALYILLVVVIVVPLLIASLFGFGMNPDEISSATPTFSIWHWLVLLLILFTIYPSIAIQTKRWHDRGKSGWWFLINFVPFIGGVWALVETGFLRGTEGANQYGNDPLA
jgi:uncharacterized membrane protein YhaH (DUF805 family)